MARLGWAPLSRQQHNSSFSMKSNKFPVSYHRESYLAVRPYIITVVIFFLPQVTVFQAQAEIQKASLFGVVLDEKSSALRNEVEHLYGKPIQSELLALEYPMAGKSRVGDDGTPIISINPRLGLRQDVIVHELYHFLLRSRGYPVILWLFPKSIDSNENRPAFKQLGFQLYDPILHRAFYSESRERLGIDPGKSLTEEARQAAIDGSIPSKLAVMDEGAIVMTYYKLRLELDDQTVFKRIVDVMENLGKHNQVVVGEHLATIVERAMPLSPARAVNALLECLNVFYAGQYTFEQRPWRERKLGSHTQHVATLELRLP
jgi:hypothetical protein